MTDTDCAAPAAKLQKVTVGDVEVASSVKMHEVLPEPGSGISSAAQAADVNGVPPSGAAVAASQNDGGKKRKVALYVAYIGAGYHVSACSANSQACQLLTLYGRALQPMSNRAGMCCCCFNSYLRSDCLS